MIQSAPMVCLSCNAYLGPDWVEVIPPSGTGYPTPICQHHTVGICSRCRTAEEDRRRRWRAQREVEEQSLREEISTALASEVDPMTIIVLLRKINYDGAGKWAKSTKAIWHKVREASVLGRPTAQVVSVEFYKPIIGPPRIREQWRRGAWGTGRAWIDTKGWVWFGDDQTTLDEPRNRSSYADKFITHQFLVPSGIACSMTTSVRKETNNFGTYRVRSWQLDGGIVLQPSYGEDGPGPALCADFIERALAHYAR
jgi:hypothetical protein